MIVRLLTEHHLEFLSLKGGCRGSSKSTHVKISHCLKSYALAQILISTQLTEITGTQRTKVYLPTWDIRSRAAVLEI